VLKKEGDKELLYDGPLKTYKMENLTPGKSSTYILIAKFKNFTSWEEEICRKTFTIPQIEKIDTKEIRLEDITNYSPQSQKLEEKYKEKNLKIDCANILITGGIGCGKSSMLNTLITAIQNTKNISKLVHAMKSREHVTKSFNCYDLKELYNVKIKLFECWGWVPDKNYESNTISAMMSGKLPNKFDMDNIAVEGELNNDPTLNDSIHCVILIVDYKQHDDDSYYKRFETFRDMALKKEISFIVVINKCDKSDDEDHDYELKQDTSQIYKSQKLYQCRKVVAEKTGANLGNIFLMRSYSDEVYPLKDINSISLFLISRVLDQCDEYYTRLLSGIAKHPQLEKNN